MPQVFISYKGEEESWAARLADTLESFGIDVWRDHGVSKGIRISEQWRPELQVAIQRSADMIVMWSQKLRGDATSVAHQEINLMKQLMDQGSNRRFIPVFLDDAPIANYWPLAPYQGEISLRPLYAKAGADGARSISDPEWYTAVLRLLDLFEVRDVVEVRYAVAAMTRLQATDLQAHPETWAQDVPAYKAVQELRLKTAPFGPTKYGPSPDDWIPFPHVDELAERTVGDLITNYDQAKRRHAIDYGKRPKWVLISYSSHMLSNEAEDRKTARDVMGNSKCLILLDPISLLHKSVYQNIVNSWGLQGRQNVFVIGAASCAYQLHADFRATVPSVVEQMGNLLDASYGKFAQPFDAGEQCVLEVGHPYQFSRWLQVAADAIIAAAQSPLRFGTMNPQFRDRVRSKVPDAPGASLVVMGSQETKP